MTKTNSSSFSGKKSHCFGDTKNYTRPNRDLTGLANIESQGYSSSQVPSQVPQDLSPGLRDRESRLLSEQMDVL